jgi:hypothetical protein
VFFAVSSSSGAPLDEEDVASSGHQDRAPQFDERLIGRERRVGVLVGRLMGAGSKRGCGHLRLLRSQEPSAGRRFEPDSGPGELHRLSSSQANTRIESKDPPRAGIVAGSRIASPSVMARIAVSGRIHPGRGALTTAVALRGPTARHRPLRMYAHGTAGGDWIRRRRRYGPTALTDPNSVTPRRPAPLRTQAGQQRCPCAWPADDRSRRGRVIGSRPGWPGAR